MRITQNKGIALKHSSSLEPSKLISVALLKLYEDDDTDIIDMYQQRSGNWLHHYIDNKVTPAANTLQSELRNLTSPRCLTTYLYIAAWSRIQPSHYIVLHRDTTDSPFTVRCRRICNVAKEATKMKDGVLISYTSLDPHVAIALKPTLTRIFGGGSVINDLPDIIASSPELSHELHMSTLTALLFTQKDSITVWGTKGKIVYDLTLATSDPFINPPIFTPVRTAPYATNVSKPKCIIYSNAPAVSGYSSTPQHIVPLVKHATIYRPPITERIFGTMISDTLFSRILPYLAVWNPNTSRAALYGLTLSPDHEPELAIYSDSCMASTVSHMPMVSPTPNSNFYQPNEVLIDILQHHLTTFDLTIADDPLIHKHLRHLRSIMICLGCSKTYNYPEQFSRWGRTLTADEIQKTSLMGTMFNET